MAPATAATAVRIGVGRLLTTTVTTTVGLLRAAALTQAVRATTSAALTRAAALTARADALAGALVRRNIARTTAAAVTGTASTSTVRIFALLLTAAATVAVSTGLQLTRALRDVALEVVGVVTRWTASQTAATWSAWLTGGRWNADE
jgi:hypothetical protein